MRVWWIYKLTNYLGFDKTYGVCAQSEEEALKALEAQVEYPCQSVECIGGIFKFPNDVDEYLSA